MDELLGKLRDCSRFLKLDGDLSDWEARADEERCRIQELREAISRKEAELAGQETSGFLKRFLGNTGGKKGKLEQQLGEQKAALKAARRDLEILENKTETAKAQRLLLAESREAYAAARKAASLTAAQETRLMLEELAAFGDPALALARKTLRSLETALLLGKDNENMKKMLLQEAVENAKNLQTVLRLLPEGFAESGSCLSDPDIWLCEKDSSETQRSLSLAVSQLQNLSNQLRAILGE